MKKEFLSLLRDRYFLLLALISTIALFLACQMWLSRPLLIDVGLESDERYVKGFYHREGDEGFSYRWTTGSSMVRFPEMGYMPTRIILAMNGARPEGQPLPRVSLLANGGPIADFVASSGIRAYEFDYFPSSFPLPRDLRLEIKSETFVPAEGGDFRTLGLLVNTLEVRPIYGSLSFPLLMVSLEIALAGTFSVALCYLVLQRMRISRWGSLGLCGLLVVSLVLNLAGRFVAIGLVLMLLPLFFLSSYGVVVLVESLGYSPRNWGELLRQGAILVVVVWALTINCAKTWRYIKPQVEFICDAPFLSYDEKMRVKWGDYYDFMVYVRDRTPPDAVIVIPPQSAWPRTGNAGLDSYFLHPRKLVRLNQIADATHVLIVKAEDGSEEVWPPGPLPDGEISWMKQGLGIIALEGNN
jgi:hypothetical protein